MLNSAPMDLDLTHFDNLDFSRQCELINQASFADKGDLILRSVSPDLLIPTLTGEDFFLIFSESGRELKPELLSQSTVEQLVFVSDFECWTKDRINREGFESWMDLLSQMDAERFTSWMVQADIELLVSGFMKFTEVLKTQHLEVIDDYIGDRPFFTVDHLYYICVEGDHYDALRQGIEILFEKRKDQYTSLMEGLIRESETMVEEDAYQLRIERLSQLGFPDKDESMRIYLEIKDWNRVDKRRKLSATGHKANLDTSMHIPVAKDQEDSLFLNQALQIYFHRYPNHDGMMPELVSLANRIIVCEDLDFKRSETLLHSIDRARHTISIGLEELSEGSLEKAVDLINQHWMETFFRWGVTVLRRLRFEAEAFYQGSGFANPVLFYHFMGSPWNYRIKGLIQLCPVKAKANPLLELEEFEDFKSLEEISGVHQELRELHELFHFVAQHTGQEWELILDQDFEGLNIAGDHLTLQMLLSTAFARLSLEDNLSFEPLDSDEIKNFVRKSFTGDAPHRRLKPTVIQRFIQELQSDTLQLNSETIQAMVRSLEEELGGLNLRLSLQTEFMPALLAKKA